ncbi:hypothetical protein MAMP_00054 [Methylophaga aminisulfidivorans MP]|uniref:Uncharacterized protein n=1 Tax=Methylophaga aminisulfidivorans MP TaxID=1026882 RepID=F5T0P7_9GAMM|nr:hypothetical protein MAMP_00054 [Methylophaga aminisulfidivorans MP]
MLFFNESSKSTAEIGLTVSAKIETENNRLVKIKKYLLNYLIH